MLRDVVVADAEREVDRVEIFERRREKRKVKREETARRGARRVSQDGTRSRRAQQQPSFRLPDAVALQIDRDVAVADRLQLRGRSAPTVSGSSARAHFVAADLDARELVVMPDAADAEAEAAQRLLGALDRPQLLVGHFGVIRNARRQAGRRRLVPRRQARRGATARGFRPCSDRPRRAGCGRRTRAPPGGPGR